MIRNLTRAGLLAASALAISAVPASANHTFATTLSTTKLEPLTGGARYEAWAIKGERKLSGGFISAAAGGGERRSVVNFPINPRSADAIAITIEPANDTDPGPSATVVLSGSVTSQGADLRFPVDLSGIAGSAILATPTDNDVNTNNDAAGLWFVDLSSGAPRPALKLPALPAGWVWEGWGVTQGNPLTTGRFTDAARPDGFNGFSGTQGGPPLPGEDFVRNLPAAITGPVNLADGNSRAVLTIEPDQAGVDPTGAGPFFVRPLKHQIPAGQAIRTSFTLGRDISEVPSGSVSFGARISSSYKGWGVVSPDNGASAASAWRWSNASGWRAAIRPTGQQVYVYPYAQGWSWTWTASTGWLAMRTNALSSLG